MAVEPSGESVSASFPVIRIKSPGSGKNCHQCRQNRDFVVACKNQRKNKPCFVKICNKCLMNRYGEKAEELATSEEWSCPKCRGICNCSVCMKKRGHQPTGLLIKEAKATGFSSVSEMLLKSAERTNHESNGADMAASLNNEAVSSSSQEGKENSFAGKLDANFLESVEKDIHDTDSCSLEKKPKKMRRNDEENKEKIPLPVGTDLTSVAGIDICAEDVGNALQFLEFCSVFEKILDMKNGEAECVLQDLLHGRPSARGKFCLTVQLHMRLLSIIQTDEGKQSATISSPYGKNSWFHDLKNCLSESRHIPKELGVDFLEKAADYDTLNASEKLRVVNLLCDEVLGTQKLKDWISDQHSQFIVKAKEARQKYRDAKNKDPILSCSKSEAEQAPAQLLESNDILLKTQRTCDAMRIEPIVREQRDQVYWKLRCEDSAILHQNVGEGDTLTLNEKWFTLDDEGKAIIEKYASSSRRNR